ncbi:SPOR domain-containing protein [Pontibacter sp. BT310]|uniref:SPOR domain-containing protein n=1 Tax=Pontibacter populi TaxID=890055 RepID=A0ABS6X9Y8_9BACT|nr:MULTISPECIES: SPOR domain-containing protein [Pontibacter]MBJ6117921.1 SPOR domain-containing protein [Pontibacter sp. BT310]MBR0570348.1 SPOR domain-containing protein [Microvirga sp. STS03]MBW3364774.1 SPOR domain-containing protein [Pontibacter populi]
MVAKHIKSLLYEHDCVIIPGFGGLITRYVPAVVHPVKHTITPPSKRVAFNEKLVLTDGLLINTIAYYNGITAVEAQQMVAAFVTQANNQLKTDNRFELSDIGIFRYNAAHRLEFEYKAGDNLLEASFGLPEISARPVRAEESVVLRSLQNKRAQDIPQNGTKFKRRLRRVYSTAAGLIIAGLTGSALYLLSLQTEYNLSSLNPLAQFNNATINNQATASDYTADYVPVTEEERLATYQNLLLNAGIATDLEADFIASTSEINDSTWQHESAALAETTEGVADQVVEEEAIVEPVLTITEKTGRFYIITGGYSRLQNAETGRDDVRENGHDGKVLTPLRGSRLFRVSAADFATAEEAQAAMNEYRKTYGNSIWVLNN